MIPKRVNKMDEEESVKMRLNDGNVPVQYKKTTIIQVSIHQESRYLGRAWGVKKVRESERYSKGRSGHPIGRDLNLSQKVENVAAR